MYFPFVRTFPMCRHFSFFLFLFYAMEIAIETRKRERKGVKYTACDTLTGCREMQGWMKLFQNEDSAAFCIRALIHRYDGVASRGELEHDEMRFAAQSARKRVLTEDLHKDMKLHALFRKIKLSKLTSMCKEFTLRGGDFVHGDRVVVHRHREKKNEWTHEHMSVSEADKRRFRHGQVTFAQLKKRYFWEPCKLLKKQYPSICIPGGMTWEFCDVETLSDDGKSLVLHKMVDRRFVVEARVDMAVQTIQRVGIKDSHVGGREVIMTSKKAQDVVIRSALEIDAEAFGRYGKIQYGSILQYRRSFDRKVCCYHDFHICDVRCTNKHSLYHH